MALKFTGLRSDMGLSDHRPEEAIMSRKRKRSIKDRRPKQRKLSDVKGISFRPFVYKEAIRNDSVHDRRRFRPDLHPAITVDGKTARIALVNTTRNNRKYRSPAERYAFIEPKKVMVCKRRKKRREVLFSLRKAGKGKKGYIKKRRNKYSDVRC